MKNKTKEIIASIFLNTLLTGVLVAAPIGFGVTGHLLPAILTASFGGAAFLTEIAAIATIKIKKNRNKELNSNADDFNVEDYDAEKSFENENEAYKFNENANSKVITDESELKNTYNTNHNQLKKDAINSIKIK